MLLNDRDQIIAMTAEWIGERYPNVSFQRE